MSGFYPGYPNPPGTAPRQQQFYSDQQSHAAPAYSPSAPYARSSAQTGMGFAPPPGPPMNPHVVGFNAAPPVQSATPPVPLGVGHSQVGKGFQPPTPNAPPPPMYNLNAAMNDMKLTGSGVPSGTPGG